MHNVNTVCSNVCNLVRYSKPVQSQHEVPSFSVVEPIELGFSNPMVTPNF